MRSPTTPQSAPPEVTGEHEGGLLLEITGAVVAGLLIAIVSGQGYFTPLFWGTTIVAAFGTYLIGFWVRHRFLLPASLPEVTAESDQARLTAAIASSRRAAYAISSNWVGLWKTSTFRYYLHLDAVMSLMAYSSGLASPLEALSTDSADQEEFYQSGLELLATIGEGKILLRKHRLRLLIYPQWAYDKYANEMHHLIRSHSAARIPCIPLVAEKLAGKLTTEEASRVRGLVRDLGQTVLDKLPPLTRRREWQARRAMKSMIDLDWMPAVFPDMLLIDAPLNEGRLWWYSASGAVNDLSLHSDTDGERAIQVFQAICRCAPNALWSNYASSTIGGVAIAATPLRLESEAFFSRRYYRDWLNWIEENAETDDTARDLESWFTHENAALERALLSFVGATQQPDSALNLLDVGCGFGRHVIDVMGRYPTWTAIGLDINEPMVTDATRRAKKAGVNRRADFLVGDAANLDHCGNAEFDLAICMTNTLGNLPKHKQAKLVRRLRQVVKPGGRVFISVYAEKATEARMVSYRAIGLDVAVQGDRIVAAEGLESEAFSKTRLRQLLQDNGLRLVEDVESTNGMGLTVVAECPRMTRSGGARAGASG